MSDYTDMAELLFGGGLEISKAEPDSADVSTKAARREKNLARVGVGANAIAIAGGTHALVAAASKDELKHGGSISRAVHRGGTMLNEGIKGIPAGKKAAEWIKANPKLGGRVAGAALGLHVAELGGDFISHHFLSQAAKKKVKGGKLKTVPKEKLKKNVGGAFILADQHQEKLREYVVPEARKIGKKTGKLSAQGALGVTKYGARKSQEAVDRLSKSEDVDIEFSGDISKMDTDKHQVFGWASVTKVDGKDVLDRQGDYISLEEIEKSAYHYVHHSRKGGNMHARDGEVPLHTSDMIESFVVTPEKLSKMGLDEDALPHGWWTGFKVNDEDLWQQVKDGKRVGFSIHGKGIRTPMEEGSHATR